MALDMKKMMERKKTLDNKGNNSFWRPQDGEQTIRIVPTADGDPFKDFWFHYNLGNNPGFLSPKRNFGEDCPLDSFVRNLWNGSDEDKRMAKKLSARQRFFAPVLVRGEETQGVRVWGFGKQVYEKLLNLVLNPEYGDITDPDSGTDLSKKSYEEVQAMLDEFLLGDSDAEEVSSETTKYNNKNTESNSVDKAFADLLGS